MIVGPHAISDGPTPHKLADVMRDASNVIMVAECADAGIGWLEPRDINAGKVAAGPIGSGPLRNPPGGINSYHGGSAYVLFCDGSVRAIQSSMDEKELQAMLRIDGGKTAQPRS